MDQTPADVARNIQAHLNQIREHLVSIDLLVGDEWPMDFVSKLRVANLAIDRMEAECATVCDEG
jgi:hypothetical protein